jgi:hypothetical protein
MFAAWLLWLKALASSKNSPARHLLGSSKVDELADLLGARFG